MHDSWLLATARRHEQLLERAVWWVRAVFDFSVLQNRSTTTSDAAPCAAGGAAIAAIATIAASGTTRATIATLSTTATAGKGDAGAPTRRH